MSPDQIGEIKREFKPGLENLVAGIIIGLLLIGGGGTALFVATKGVIDAGGQLPVYVEKGWCWAAVGLMIALGLGLVIAGVFLIRWVRSLCSFRVSLGEPGFTVFEKPTVRAIGWDDINSVREIHLYERPPVLKGVAKYALPQVLSKSFAIHAREGEPITFDGTAINGHAKLARLIKEETGKRNIPWEVVESKG